MIKKKKKYSRTFIAIKTKLEQIGREREMYVMAEKNQNHPANEINDLKNR